MKQNKNQMEYVENNSTEAKYHRAKKRIREEKKFYSSLMSYVFFIAFLAFINYYTNGWGYMWFLWAAFGWGIGIVTKAIKVFRLNPFFGKNWEEKKIQELMKKEEQQNKWN